MMLLCFCYSFWDTELGVYSLHKDKEKREKVAALDYFNVKYLLLLYHSMFSKNCNRNYTWYLVRDECSLRWNASSVPVSQ